MALKKWAYVYLSPNFSPEKNTTRTNLGTCVFISVGLDFKDKDRVLDIAEELYIEGVQMIELCGGFGPVWLARVSEFLCGAIPVGCVVYGPESRQTMLDILNK